MPVPEISALLGRGDFDQAAERLPRLAKLLALEANFVQALQARVLASMVYLPRMQLDDARRCWGDLIPAEEDASCSVARQRLRDICGGDSALLGLALCEIANFLFRTFRSAQGSLLVTEGVKCLEGAQPRSGLDPTFLKHAKIHASVWKARLNWQEEHRSVAFAELKAQLDHIAVERERASRDDDGSRCVELAPGLDLAEGIVRDILAELYSIEGHMDAALETIRQALVLMSGVRDRCRLGHVCYMYAKLQAVRATDLEWNRRLFQRAHDLYPESHPFRYRVSNQLALLLIRGGELQQAHELLEQAEARLAADRAVSGSEHWYCAADFALTRGRILEQEALHHRRPWQDCLDGADRARARLPWARLPARFEAELDLHRGRALTHCGQPRIALETLHSKAASQAPNASTRVALRFARAEAHLKLDEPDVARAEWQEGRKELSGVGSAFLERWDEQLERLFQVGVRWGETFPEAQKDFHRIYLGFHFERLHKERELGKADPQKATLKTFAEKIRWSESSLRRRFEELGLEGEARRLNLLSKRRKGKRKAKRKGKPKP